MKEKLARLREWSDRLAPRERRLLGVLGVVAGLFVLSLVPLGVSFMLGSRRDANKALAGAIAAVKGSRDEVQRRKERREAIVARYTNRAPALAGLLEKAARDNHLEIPESQDRPEVPHGKRYVERSTVIRLRKTGMLQLAKMLEALEQQRMPIAISRLNVRRRAAERDSYDVEVGVSAFDRSEPSKEAGPVQPATGGGK